MAELIGGPLTDSLAEQSMGQQAFQTTPGEGMESMLGSVFQGLPTVGLTRGFTRDTTAREAVQNTGGPAVDPRTASSDVDAMAAERGAGPDTTHVNPDDANKQAAAVGAKMTPFTAPVSKHALDSLIEDHLAEQKRQDVIDRSASTILNNPVTRFGVGALVSLADPLNIAAMMIPVAPEAFVAGKLAAASGLAGRTAIRAGVGAAQGAVGMAALEPLTAFNDYQEHTEWSVGGALRNIGFGALMGGAGHALLGGLADRLGRVDPQTRDAALRASVAQQMEGRPIDVEAILAKGEAEASTAPPPAIDVPEARGVWQHQSTETTPVFGDRPAWFTREGDNFYKGEGAIGEDGKPIASTIKAQLNFRNPFVESKATPDMWAALEQQLRDNGVPPDTIATFMKDKDFEFGAHMEPWLVDALKKQGFDGVIADQSWKSPWAIALSPRDQVRLPPTDPGPSARTMATRALNPEPDPEIARATKANTATIERAPKLDATDEKNLTEITKQAAELQARYDAEVAAGRLRDHPSIADIGKDIEDRGKAASDYAACFVSRGG